MQIVLEFPPVYLIGIHARVAGQADLLVMAKLLLILSEKISQPAFYQLLIPEIVSQLKEFSEIKTSDLHCGFAYFTGSLRQWGIAPFKDQHTDLFVAQTQLARKGQACQPSAADDDVIRCIFHCINFSMTKKEMVRLGGQADGLRRGKIASKIS